MTAVNAIEVADRHGAPTTRGGRHVVPSEPVDDHHVSPRRSVRPCAPRELCLPRKVKRIMMPVYQKPNQDKVCLPQRAGFHNFFTSLLDWKAHVRENRGRGSCPIRDLRWN